MNISRILANCVNQITQTFAQHCAKCDAGNGWARGVDVVGYHNRLDKLVAHSAGCVVKVVDYVKAHEADKEGMGYGNYIIISNFANPDLYVLYAHIEPGSIPKHIKPGYFVSRGEVIGTMGNSGNSFGAHVHFELRKKKKPEYGTKNEYWHNTEYFEWLNPEPYLDEDLPTNKPVKTLSTTTKKKIIVQLNAFTVYTNAINYCDKINAKGYPAYVFKEDNLYKIGISDECNKTPEKIIKELGIGFKKQITTNVL